MTMLYVVNMFINLIYFADKAYTLAKNIIRYVCNSSSDFDGGIFRLVQARSAFSNISLSPATFLSMGRTAH